MFENRYGSTDTFKMAANQRTITCAIFSIYSSVWPWTLIGTVPTYENPPPLPKPKPSQLSQPPLGHLGGPDTAQRHDILLSQK